MSDVSRVQSEASDNLIYLLDSDRQFISNLVAKFRDSSFHIASFYNLDELKHAVKTQVPMVIISDIAFIENRFFADLKKEYPKESEIICVSDSDTIDLRLSAVRNGIKRFFTKPLNFEDFFLTLNGISSATKEKNPYRILCIDDEEISLRCNQAVLEKDGMQVEILSEPLSTLKVLAEFKPDVIVLDVYMPECSGIELAQVIRQDKRWTMIPIVFLSSESDLDKQLETLNLGGDDFLVKPLKAEHFSAAILARAKRARMVKRLNRELSSLSLEHQFQFLTMDQHNIVSITDTEGIITHVNQRFCEISGYSQNELIGQTHRLLNSGFHSSAFYSKMWEQITQGNIWHGTLCNRKNSGEEFWLATTIVPYLDKNGTPYQYVSIRTDISAFKQSQERLQRSQVFANIGTWDWNLKTDELFWSERVAPLFGYDYEISKTTFDHFISSIYPEDKKRVMDAMQNCIGGGSDYEIEHRIVWPDGSIHWMLANGNVVRDNNGTPLHMMGVIKCIDKRKKTELMLAERDRLLLEAQSLAHIGNWHLDANGNKLTWSDEVFKILGLEPNQIKPCFDYFLSTIHPEDKTKYLYSRKRAEESGQSDSTYRIIRNDGKIRYIHDLTRADKDAQQNIQHLMGTIQDISERVESQHKLWETEKRFTLAVEGAGDGIWDWNMENNIVQLSHNYLHFLGYSEHELPSNFAEMEHLVHPEDRDRNKKNLNDYLNGTITKRAIEIRLRHKNGSYIWVLCRATIISRNSEQTPIRMIGIQSDISQQKKTEQELIQARQEAETANQAKSQFLSSMSHELRTPMNAIMGFSQLLKMDQKNPLATSQIENVEEILKAGKHLQGLINEVLDLSRIEAGRANLYIEPVSLTEVIIDSIQLIMPLAQKRGININLKLDNQFKTIEQFAQSGFTVKADHTRLKQILLNLISNAIKYNCASGEIEINVSRGETKYVRVDVSDTGYGLTEQQQNMLFKPFNRLGIEKTDIEGTGIGLVICKRLIEQMQGTIGFQSKIRQGSTFWFELPADKLSPSFEQQDKLGTLSGSVQKANSHTGKSILYIEDNPANLLLVSQLIELQTDFNLISAHEPYLGLELVAEHQPDIILLDINLPGMNGFEVLNHLKKNESTRTIPVIAISANAMPQDIKQALSAGFNHYVTKPIDIREILNVFEEALQVHH